MQIHSAPYAVTCQTEKGKAILFTRQTSAFAAANLLARRILATSAIFHADSPWYEKQGWIFASNANGHSQKIRVEKLLQPLNFHEAQLYFNPMPSMGDALEMVAQMAQSEAIPAEMEEKLRDWIDTQFSSK